MIVKPHDMDEEESLRSVALQTANSVRIARQRAEDELVGAKQALESRTAELEWALLELKTQLDIAQVLVNARTIDQVASKILEALCRNLSWTCAQLWRVDREAGTIRRAAGWYDGTIAEADFQALAQFELMNSGTGLPGRIWQSRVPAWIPEVEIDTNFPRTSLVRSAGLKSAFGFPLIVSGEVSAVIELFSRERRPVEESILKIAVALGSHIGQFIEREAAETDQKKALRELRRLQEVTATALANLPLKQLFENLLPKICEAIDCDMAVALLLDDEASELYVEAMFGPNMESLYHLRVRVGESLAGRVAVQRKLTIVRNAATDRSIRPALRALGFKTVLGLPLLARNNLIGVLEVGSFSDREFTDDETDFLQLIAQQAAIAIENSSLYEEARELNRLKDRFLSVASHELRTPLTAILGWSELLKRSIDDATRSEATRAIQSSARTLAELIEDLLDASRVREGKLVLRREAMDLPSVVTAALQTVEPAANQRGVKLEAEIPASALPVQGDPGRIRQVVWNLLANAIKFTPSGKTVRTFVRVDSIVATITVADEGDGIDPQFLPHIFDELQQEEKGKRAGGLGLGLFIVKTIVDMHGGTVEARSDGPGRGATFIVRLPVNLAETSGT